MAGERVRLGKDASLHYSTNYAGDVDAATWVEIETVENVQVSRDFMQTPTRSRRTNGINTQENTLLTPGVTFDFLVHKAEAVFGVLETAQGAGTIMHFLVLNGPIDEVGARGIVMPAQISNWPEDQPLEGNIRLNGLQLICCDHQYPFARVTIS